MEGGGRGAGARGPVRLREGKVLPGLDDPRAPSTAIVSPPSTVRCVGLIGKLESFVDFGLFEMDKKKRGNEEWELFLLVDNRKKLGFQ